MKATRPARRPAFTLVEMLVVILIMSILVTLVTLGVTRAMRYASEVGTKTEMAQIEQALGVAALDLGRVSYIPSYLILKNDFSTYNAADPWEAMSKRLLMQMFNLPANANIPWHPSGGAVLKGDQAFVFILGGVPDTSAKNVLGFAKGANPMASGGGNRKGPYFNFKPERLVDGGNGFFKYMDNWNNAGAFLVAYSSQMVGGAVNTNPDLAGPPRMAKSVSGSGQLYMPKGYQIFSAGKDGKWGSYSATVAFNGLLQGDGEDDQCNFSESPLGKPIND
mgnify:CR=1 FL=1